MSVTDEIASKVGSKPSQEFWTYLPGYTMFNTSSPEVEVCEFLWALVRLIKPEKILECGTGYGISAAYMALALRQNGRGELTTVEMMPDPYDAAALLLHKLDLRSYVHLWQGRAEDFTPEGLYDILFLDTEPNARFAEFLRFWPSLKPGGVVIIHDLHAYMSQNGETVAGIDNWPFGTIPNEVDALIRGGELQSFHLTTPRGLYIGQKASEKFYTTSVLKGIPWVPWTLDHAASHL